MNQRRVVLFGRQVICLNCPAFRVRDCNIDAGLGHYSRVAEDTNADSPDPFFNSVQPHHFTLSQRIPRTEMEESSPFLKPPNCYFGCQAKIALENTVFHVCKEQLAACSEYFRSLFFGGFRESADDGEICIDDEKPEDFLNFLSALLPHPVTSDIHEGSLAAIIRLADKFQAPELKKKALNFLTGYLHTCEASEYMELMVLCDRYNVPKGVRACLPYCLQLPFNTLRQYHEKLDRGVLAALYAAKLETVFDAVPRIAGTVATTELKASVPCFFCGHVTSSLFKCCKRVICQGCRPDNHKCKAGESYVCDSCGLVALLRKDAAGCKCKDLQFAHVLLKKEI